MSYEIRLSHRAEKDLDFWQRSSPKDFRKILDLLHELSEHPRSGTGWPEYLQGKEKCWSRHINKKDVMKYEIHDREIYVLVLSARGHYDDH